MSQTPSEDFATYIENHSVDWLIKEAITGLRDRVKQHKADGTTIDKLLYYQNCINRLQRMGRA